MSRKTQARHYKIQGRAQKRAERAVVAKSRAMNAAMMSNSSGMGGRQDKTVGDRPTMSQWANPFVYGQSQLFAAQYAWVLHSSDWMARKIIDIPVFDMFRQGWDWKYQGKDGEVDDALDRECRRVDFYSTLINAKKMEGLVGGCVAIRVTREKEGVDTEDPVTPEQIDKGDILGYNIVPSIYIKRVEWQRDESKPGYNKPVHYFIRDKMYHRSRLMIFDGQPISPYPQYDFLTNTGNWNSFGISRFAPIWDVLIRANAYQQGAAHLSDMASVWFALYKGLKDLRGTRQGNKALDEMRYIVETMSQYKAVILDGEDVDVKQIGASFGSVPELIMSGLQIVCAAADIPGTRFLGQAPGGLSTDDKSGLENYYNDIGARQTIELDPILDREKPYLLNSALGIGIADAREVTQDWIPLWNLSETELADIRTKDVQNVIALESSNLLTREDAIKELESRDAINVRPDLAALEEQDRRQAEARMMGGGELNEQPEEPGNGFQALNASDWDEYSHPRSDDGRFGKGGSGKTDSDSNRPLDHGELSIPGRLKNLDREIDRFKREEEIRQKKDAKEKTARVKESREEAKALLAEYGERLVESTFSKHGSNQGMTKKAIRDQLKSMAYFNPSKCVQLLQRYAREIAEKESKQ